MRAHAAQAAQQVGDVAAEDAAQHVELVDHDVAQAHEEGGPARVVGQEADVQHLGVGEHHVGVAAHPRACVGRGVAVVGGGDQPGSVQLDEGAELVLGQGLGGEEQQRRRRCARLA